MEVTNLERQLKSMMMKLRLRLVNDFALAEIVRIFGLWTIDIDGAAPFLIECSSVRNILEYFHSCGGTTEPA